MSHSLRAFLRTYVPEHEKEFGYTPTVEEAVGAYEDTSNEMLELITNTNCSIVLDSSGEVESVTL